MWFADGARFILPSGESLTMNYIEGYYGGFYETPYESISSWLVNGLLWGHSDECGDEELKEILGDLDFSRYDGDIVSFFFEYGHSVESEVTDLEKIVIENGIRLDYIDGRLPSMSGKNVFVFPFPCVVFASKEEIEEKVRESGGIPVEDLSSAEIAIVDGYDTSAFRLAKKAERVKIAVNEKAFAVSLCDDSGWPSERDKLKESWGDFWDDWFGRCRSFDEIVEEYGLCYVSFRKWDGKKWA